MLLHVVTVPLPATPVETGVAEHHASAARAGKPGLRRQLAVSARAPASGRAGTGTG
ncbi:arsenite efflux pump ArsB [Cupriavidus consociatus]|uniref:arsenite efflux pump ArsB n=1 Tax=Cupriavidus consociatus TaxID=2821357 RepID=UPI001FD7BF8B|nr:MULTISPECIES: arsenite efflux pump ArsB [unclassified Cupriavidus]MDK2655921.1 arsenite efflux pump ArsB [Cupriavidus sp. LEh21]